jgi:hypothetical protein
MVVVSHEHNRMTKQDLPKYLKLRKMGDSLYLTVPKEFVRAHTLNPDDDVFWMPEPDGIKLRFEVGELLRADPAHTPAMVAASHGPES